MGLIDLPTELVLEIMSWLDDPSLIQLAAVCKSTNFMALKLFYTRNDIEDPSESGTFVATTYGLPPETLSAVCLDLSVQTLSHIDYVFSRSGSVYPTQLSDLCSLLGRLTSVDSVSLDLPTEIRRQKKHVRRLADVQLWRERTMSVLDALIAKSCTTLHITGGSIFAEDLHNDQEDPIVDNIHSSTASPSSAGKLQNLHLARCSFFRQSLYQWTISILSPSGSASSTLTTLDLDHVEISLPMWTYLLEEISLPKLADLRIVICYSNPPSAPSFALFHAFCMRHPTITSLLLQHWLPDRSNMPTIPKLSILPNLSTLNTTLEWLDALLDGLDSYSEALPNLHSIELQIYFNDPFALVDAALERLTNFPPGRKFALHLEIGCDQDRRVWFMYHVNLGKRSSFIARLECVSRLSVGLDIGREISRETVEAMAEWLQLFPCVEHVGLPSQWRVEDYADVILDPIFLDRLANACPEMKVVEVCSERVDLVKVREGVNLPVKTKAPKRGVSDT